jgi:hypothetical protein
MKPLGYLILQERMIGKWFAINKWFVKEIGISWFWKIRWGNLWKMRRTHVYIGGVEPFWLGSFLLYLLKKKLGWPILYYNCEGALWRGIEEKVWEKVCEICGMKYGNCVFW